MMQNLVTRFHLLLVMVTLGITGVAFIHIPADFAYAAHWTGNAPDWLWPRDIALLTGPALQLLLLGGFFGLGRLLTKNHFAKTQHIFEPALSLVLAVIAATQLGLLFDGIGSDLDLVRFTAVMLGLVLIVLGVVLFEAERHTYAGLRMPWPIPTDRAWNAVHRSIGSGFGLAGLCLLALAWLDPGIGMAVLAFALALVLPVLLAGLVTLLWRKS
jgi:uncharacterized membrane protein